MDLTKVRCRGRINTDLLLDNGSNYNSITEVYKDEIVNVYDNVPYWIENYITGERKETGVMHYIKKKYGKKFLCVEDKYITLLIS